MKTLVFILFGAVLSLTHNVIGQERLRSASYGLDMMLLDFPAERIIEEIRYEDGVNDIVNVIRFDQIGPGLCPLIISSRMPIATDSLGLFPIKLHESTMNELIDYINSVSPKIHSRNVDFVLIKVTYRYDGVVNQYYMTNDILTTMFLKPIEKLLIEYDDRDGLVNFYNFVNYTDLLTVRKGKTVWKYEPFSR